MLSVAGLLLLTSSAPAEMLSTTDVTAYYKDTWLASLEEKSRCAVTLQALATDDILVAKRNGVAIDQAMRETRCLDSYSYIYGRSILPSAPTATLLDTPSIDVVGSYLFVYINTFDNKGEDLLAKIEKISEPVRASVKTVVIDVRGNPGGQIDTLRKVLDLSFSPRAGMRFLELSGKATYGTFYTTTRTGIFAGRDIRILTDPHTASSSEWMIETLCFEWYPDKCTTLGNSPTFGKSLLQCINKDASLEVKLTCGEWYMADKYPSGKDQSKLPQRIQGIGITPDKLMIFAECERFGYTCIARELADAGL